MFYSHIDYFIGGSCTTSCVTLLVYNSHLRGAVVWLFETIALLQHHEEISVADAWVGEATYSNESVRIQAQLMHAF